MTYRASAPGSTFDPASPGPIGGTTPAAITGTTITATTKFLAPYNTPGTAGFGFSSSTAGFTHNAGDDSIVVIAGGGRPISFGGSQILIRSAGAFAFDSTTDIINNTPDLKLTRYAAKQLMISGDGVGATTNAGLILGYWGSTGVAGIWPSTVTPSGANSVLYFDNSNTILQSVGVAGNVYINTAGVTKITQATTAGAGPSITAGTAADNTPRALSISQTWTDGTSSNVGIVGNFDMGATGTATGKLLSLQAGAAGTTEVFSVSQGGALVTSGSITATANSFVGLSYFVDSNASAGYLFGTGNDANLSRVAAGIIGVGTGAAGSGAGALFLSERTAPSAPAANGVYIYAQDNGAGKTQLMALFASGAAQQIAIEP